LVDEQIANLKTEQGDFADRRDDLTFGWAPYPPTAPEQVYLVVTVPLTAKLPTVLLPDLKCSISYWLMLAIDADARLHAYVAAVGVWVEAGLLSGSVGWRLKAAAWQAVDTLNAELAAGLEDLNKHGWADWYLMPGKFPIGAAPFYPKDYAGNTLGEVTVVLIPK
jgi:hypothetical protein